MGYDSIKKLVNISEGKNAIQSSISRWSKENDANRLIDSSYKNLDFAFHTDLENNPWWMLDLEKVFKIEKIVIYNRKKYHQNKSRTLKVEYSMDSQKWYLIHQGFMYWGNKIEFKLNSVVNARYIKLSLEENQYFHLSHIDVFSKEYLIVAARGDGIGGRLQALLNAMYIAETTSLKFGFVWKEELGSFAKDFQKEQKIGNNTIVAHANASENKIFTEDFIRKYSYTSTINISQGILRSKKVSSLDKLLEIELENSWGWYSPLDSLDIIFEKFDKNHYNTTLPKLWKKIGFSDRIKELISFTDQLHIEYTAIHIRSGDIVYGEYRYIGKRFSKKALPIHLALGVIENLIKDNKKVILFGDDITSNKEIKKIFKSKDIYIIDDFLPNNIQNLSSVENAIFEISLMSKSNNIFASGSSYFSTLASSIGGVKVISLYKYLTKKEQYNSIKEQLSLYSSFHDLQIAFSYFHLYILGVELNINLEELEENIKQAMRYDKNNYKYKIFLIDILLQKNDILEAEKILKKIIEKDKKHDLLIKMLTEKIDGKYWYSLIFNKVLNLNKDMAYLLYISAHIMKLKGNSIASKKYIDSSMKLCSNSSLLKKLIEGFNL